ncbi:hypothetical protein [Streptomyces sp. XY413]|uniref:hypothetical protein n=1 Tax=Streptomyces sp. XY413 TaxID=1519479 RepID=UPI00131B0243|nr:hypothetical protein [Streptomyces sp. XY413]
MLRTVQACGSHTDHDGHALWALLDAQPRPKKRLAPGHVCGFGDQGVRGAALGVPALLFGG